MLVGDRMQREVITIDRETSLRRARRVMAHHRVRHLPVVEKGRLVGIVSIGDVVKAQRDLYRGEVENLQMELTEEHGRPTAR